MNPMHLWFRFSIATGLLLSALLLGSCQSQSSSPFNLRPPYTGNGSTGFRSEVVVISDSVSQNRFLTVERQVAARYGIVIASDFRESTEPRPSESVFTRLLFLTKG